MENVNLKVAAKSNPKSVAGSIVNNIREKKNVEIIQNLYCNSDTDLSLQQPI